MIANVRSREEGHGKAGTPGHKQFYFKCRGSENLINSV